MLTKMTVYYYFIFRNQKKDNGMDSFIVDKTIKTNCSVDETIFVHHDYIEKGYCIILKKK